MSEKRRNVVEESQLHLGRKQRVDLRVMSADLWRQESSGRYIASNEPTRSVHYDWLSTCAKQLSHWHVDRFAAAVIGKGSSSKYSTTRASQGTCVSVALQRARMSIGMVDVTQTTTSLAATFEVFLDQHRAGQEKLGTARALGWRDQQSSRKCPCICESEAEPTRQCAACSPAMLALPTRARTAMSRRHGDCSSTTGGR